MVPQAAQPLPRPHRTSSSSDMMNSHSPTRRVRLGVHQAGTQTWRGNTSFREGGELMGEGGLSPSLRVGLVTKGVSKFMGIC